MQVLTEQRRASSIKDMDILEHEIWDELQRNKWLMDLVMKQRSNQVSVNHVLMVSRVHCHFPRQEEKGLMNSLVLFKVMHVERLSEVEYFVTCSDDKPRFVWVYTLKHKSEVFESLLN